MEYTTKAPLTISSRLKRHALATGLVAALGVAGAIGLTKLVNHDQADPAPITQRAPWDTWFGSYITKEGITEGVPLRYSVQNADEVPSKVRLYQDGVVIEEAAFDVVPQLEGSSQITALAVQRGDTYLLWGNFYAGGFVTPQDHQYQLGFVTRAGISLTEPVTIHFLGKE